MLALVLNRENIPDEQMKTFKKSLVSSEKLMSLKYHLLLNDYVSAEKLLSDIEKSKNSNLAEFRLLKIFYYIEQGNTEKSLSLLDSLEVPESYSQYYFQLKLESLVRSKKFLEALALTEKLDNSKEIVLNKVFCLCNLQDFNLALEVLESFRKQEDNKNDFILKLCKYYLKQKFDKCLSSLENRTEYNFDYLYLKLFCLTKLSQFSEASKLLNEILSSKNKIKDIWVLGGIIFYNQSILSDSFLCFSKAIQFDRESPNDLFNLSKLYFDSNPKNFEKIKRKIVSFSPDFEVNSSLDFKYPVINFNDFGKRKTEALPLPVVKKNKFFVKPVAKNKILFKKKCKNDFRDSDTIALIMGAMKYDCTGGFKEVIQLDLPIKRSQR